MSFYCLEHNKFKISPLTQYLKGLSHDKLTHVSAQYAKAQLSHSSLKDIDIYDKDGIRLIKLGINYKEKDYRAFGADIYLS